MLLTKSFWISCKEIRAPAVLLMDALSRDSRESARDTDTRPRYYVFTKVNTFSLVLMIGGTYNKVCNINYCLGMI